MKPETDTDAMHLPASGRAGGVRAPGPSKLTRRQKAAIIVRLLLSGGRRVGLDALPEELQAGLTEEMAGLRLIGRETLRDVAGEFLEELESVGLAFSGGMEGALSVLEGSISPATAGRLRSAAGIRAATDPWERIAGLDDARLRPLLEEESVEVAAVILSKLGVGKAAALLGQIPGARARRIAYAMSLTGNVTPDVLDRIGFSLARQLDAQPDTVFADGPVERVGAILNSSPANTRDDVLEGLEQTDSAFAAQVRRAIFTFANIPARLDPRDVPKVVRGLEQAALARAVAAARATGLGEAADFILQNMSKRMAEQIEEDVRDAGEVRQADGEEAMNTVVARIRELEAEGEIFLVAEED